MYDETKNKTQFVTIFADASFCPETKALGWAGWCKYGDGITVKAHGHGMAKSSNHAEFEALTNICKHVMKMGVPYEDAIVVIQSDCIGALDRFKPPFKGAKYIKKRHVRGHQGNKDARSAVNTYCDNVAYNEMSGMRHFIRSREESAND